MRSWKDVKEQQLREEQEKAAKEEKVDEVVIVGVKDGALIAKPPEEIVPKWGITLIRDKRTGEERPHINLKGLLWLAHKDSVGLEKIETEILESKEDYVLIKATVHCKRGIFSAHGTWKPRFDNDTRGLEVAESRAVARALRFATGAGTSVEELPEEYFEQLEKR